MIKVTPFIYTNKTEKYKKFLNEQFKIDMLYPIFNEGSCKTLFYGWHGKNMLNWYKFTNDDKIILEFYPTYYTVQKNIPNSIKYMLSIPKTINEFINDMHRFGIDLYWGEWIDFDFEPIDYLHLNSIKEYYVNLLGKMDKSHELL